MVILHAEYIMLENIPLRFVRLTNNLYIYWVFVCVGIEIHCALITKSKGFARKWIIFQNKKRVELPECYFYANFSHLFD